MLFVVIAALPALALVIATANSFLTALWAAILVVAWLIGAAASRGILTRLARIGPRPNATYSGDELLDLAIAAWWFAFWPLFLAYAIGHRLVAWGVE